MKITDKMRLDFLTKISCNLACDSLDKLERWILDSEAVADKEYLPGTQVWCQTPRQALDKAIRAKNKERKCKD